MKNVFSNITKMESLSRSNWEATASAGLIDVISSRAKDGSLITANGHSFYNMVSCSYLGLDSHPAVLQGVCEAVRDFPQTNIISSRARLRSRLLADTEANLSSYFGANVMLGTSCSALSQGILPLLASGLLTDGSKPRMIFDPQCHFSMNALKAVCADETDVATCLHNDLEMLESACKSGQCVVYVCDGAYSTGGFAPMAGLLDLQKRYNLYVYYDDSHSLSVCGPRGYGFVRSSSDFVPEKTFVVCSLAKAFGAGAGGMVVLPLGGQFFDRIQRYAGPLLWSQPVSTPVLGAIGGALGIHSTAQLPRLQAALKARMKRFDEIVCTAELGSPVPIRFVNVAETDAAIAVAKEIFDDGFFVAPLFFPIVARGRSGVRMMINLVPSDQEFERFCQTVRRARDAHF